MEDFDTYNEEILMSSYSATQSKNIDSEMNQISQSSTVITTPPPLPKIQLILILLKVVKVVQLKVILLKSVMAM